MFTQGRGSVQRQERGGARDRGDHQQRRVGAAVEGGAEGAVAMVRRVGDDGRSWLFAINHTQVGARLPAPGIDLSSGAVVIEESPR